MYAFVLLDIRAVWLTCAGNVMAGITPAPTADGTVLPTPGDFQYHDILCSAHSSKKGLVSGSVYLQRARCTAFECVVGWDSRLAIPKGFSAVVANFHRQLGLKTD